MKRFLKLVNGLKIVVRFKSFLKLVDDLGTMDHMEYSILYNDHGFSSLTRYELLCLNRLPRKIAVFLLGFKAVISLKTAEWLCKHFGHKIDYECHAGTESGYEDFSCKRCGHSDQIIYY